MQEFLEIIKQMHESSQRDFFPNLLGFFHKINTLSRDEVLAAFQAFNILKREVLTETERTTNFELLDKIRDAFIARMCMICCDTSVEIRSEVAVVFWRATDRHYAIQRFIQKKSEDKK